MYFKESSVNDTKEALKKDRDSFVKALTDFFALYSNILFCLLYMC